MESYDVEYDWTQDPEYRRLYTEKGLGLPIPAPTDPKESAVEHLARILDAGKREVGYIDHPRPEGAAVRTLKEAGTAGFLDLRRLTIGAMPGRQRVRSLIGGTDPGRVVDLPASIAGNSSCCRAGSRLIVCDDAPLASTGPVIAWQQQAGGFNLIEAAAFAPVVDGEDVTTSEWPIHRAEIVWTDAPSCAVSFRATRSEQKSHSVDLAVALMESIILGLAKEADRVLLAGVLALVPDTNPLFSWQMAADMGVRWEELQCFVNNPSEGSADGESPLVVDGGKLFYRRLPAELTRVPANLAGAWNRAAVAIHPLLNITAKRLNVQGDLEISCFCNLQALVPKPEFFWRIA